MKCPFCGFPDTKVVDSREVEDGTAVRRRRECEKCGMRFTTYEKYELTPLQVIKKDGRRELFDKQKIIRGIITACEKRNVPMEKIKKMADEVEQELRCKHPDGEVSSKEIGERILRKLRKVDKVAYIRFASVYKNFEGIDEFISEIKRIKRR